MREVPAPAPAPVAVPLPAPVVVVLTNKQSSCGMPKGREAAACDLEEEAIRSGYEVHALKNQVARVKKKRESFY